MKLSVLKQALSATCAACSTQETALGRDWKQGLGDNRSQDSVPKQSGLTRGYEM